MFRRDPQLPREIPPVPPPRHPAVADLGSPELDPISQAVPPSDASDRLDSPSPRGQDTSDSGPVSPEPRISEPLPAPGETLEEVGRSEPPARDRAAEGATIAEGEDPAGFADAGEGPPGDRPTAASPDAPISSTGTDAPGSPDDDRRPLTALPTPGEAEPTGTKPEDGGLRQDGPWPIGSVLGSGEAAAPRLVPPLEEVWASDDIPYQPKELGVVDQLMVLLADGVAQWKRLLRWVRSQLPPNLQLSDEVLTAIALGVLILLLALGNPLGAKRGAEPVAAPALPRVVAEQPGPGEAEPLARPAAEVAPAAATQPPDPTPEQGLIADIQERVSTISRSYAVGLIQSVEVNLPAHTLGVNLAEAWYGLLPSQQDDIAQDIYRQAQGLAFGTLQLRDPEGVVVARSPVVGDTMVVLRRLRSAEAG